MIKEACVETFEQAMLAEKKGANRIELCSELSVGGLTPAAKLMKKTCSVLKIPVMVMIRPRAGNFHYSEEEISQMKQEIDLAKKAGAAGVVFGLLTSKNQIDIENTRILADYATPLPVTFHKAIDELENPADGVPVLKNIRGITRILTSGGKATADEGAEVIRKMKEATGENLTIVAAGKITDKNINQIQKLTQVSEFHGKQIVGNLNENSE
ncbi:MAG: copper homeostasis protein CutC [Bacteroidales bacterium]|jgi:copper homeostasis protein|nr:copper homeostasis protein CutC [Mariniphaga sp.]NLB93166.1 copper homeostasis protein CutC [Bacteroidales bacterium]